MGDKIRILVVDDHQLMIEGIVGALQQHGDYDITTCNTCDTAFKNLQEAETPFTILFTDLSFENQTDETELDGGEALIRKIKENEIAVKIGVVTGHTETNRVFNVINNLNPDAYILKNHCSGDELNFAIQQMMKGEQFYTHEIHQKIMKRNIVQIQMDEIAIQILKELPRQTKIVNLEGKIKKSDGNFMKIRAIENKLANLRIDLNAKNNTDLVLKAKELGIID
ncbi:response regulator [Pseudotenacibaculum sp. MALMAid0570]|uniref:response regulator n=1 Tax=Pseudotenacibaculum sp. MALMAid0570 TaxID=3143938 RepID=UPI0032DF0AF2